MGEPLNALGLQNIGIGIFGLIYLIASFVAVLLYGWMIQHFFRGLPANKKPWFPSEKTLATCSVIIPVRNEEKHIGRILSTLISQTFPVSRMEVIVTDDHSSDATKDIVMDFAGNHPDFPLRWVESSGDQEKKIGKKQAIARAVSQARGEVVLCTDADTWHSSGWVEAMMSGFNQQETMMVLGPVAFADGRNLLQRLQGIEFLGIMGTTAGSAAIGFPVMCNGANMAYRCHVFESVGGYSANMDYVSGDDQFLLSSVRRKFGKKAIVFMFNSDAIVNTVAESTLMGFLHQRLRWISKSPGYRDPIVIASGLVTWFMIILIFSGLVAGFFSNFLLVFAFFMLMIKMIFDYRLVRWMSLFFGKREPICYYILAQLFQVVYVPVLSLAGLILPFRWKGRRG